MPKLLRFVLMNFGPILVFYIANHFGGIKVGVVCSVTWVFAEILLCYVRKIPISLFFKFSAALTIIFGLVDLYLQQSVLFKYEPCLSNILVGAFFASSLLGQKPIILEFAQARGNISGKITPDRLYYFKFLTVVWSIYMFAKAAFYFWIAMNYSLEEGLVIRSGVGTVSFYLLLAISIFGAPYIKLVLAKFKWLPSSKSREQSLHQKTDSY